jgi:CAP12/Pycsar effector protein, TIR domain
MKNNPKNNTGIKAKLTVSRSEAKSKLSQRYDAGKEIKEIIIFSESELDESEKQYKKWTEDNVKLLKIIFNTEQIAKAYLYTSGVTNAKADRENPFPGRHKNFQNTLKAKLNKLETIINGLESFQTEFDSVEKPINDNCIFVGHSRSKLLTKLIAFLEDELNIKTITYDSESKEGDSITSVSEKLLNTVAFAILILTPEDETKEDKIKVHRNLVYETGLFQGKLGFKKVLILHQRGIGDLPDFTKAHSIKLIDKNIEQIFIEVKQILKSENIIN